MNGLNHGKVIPKGQRGGCAHAFTEFEDLCVYCGRTYQEALEHEEKLRWLLTLAKSWMLQKEDVFSADPKIVMQTLGTGLLGLNDEDTKRVIHAAYGWMDQRRRAFTTGELKKL